jgi:glycine oxidase
MSKKPRTDQDCIVVGAGAIGLLTAWYLRKSRLAVTVLDQSRPFSGASWAGGGILSPVPPWHYPAQVDELVRSSLLLYPGLIAELQNISGLALDFATTGLLFTGPFDDHAEPWRRAHPEDVAQGLLSEWQPHCDDRLAWLLKHTAQLRNPRLGKALLAGCVEKGIAVLPEHAAQVVDTGIARRLAVVCSNGVRLEADHIVIAAGAWTDSLLHDSGLSGYGIRPLRGQMLLLQGQSGQLRYIVSGHGKYLIPRPDGLILCGSTVEDVGFDVHTTPQARESILRDCIDLFPPARDLPVVRQWAGLRPGIANDVPVIAQHQQLPGLWINSGHYRNGLGMAPASAQRLAQMVTDSKLVASGA